MGEVGHCVGEDLVQRVFAERAAEMGEGVGGGAGCVADGEVLEEAAVVH